MRCDPGSNSNWWRAPEKHDPVEDVEVNGLKYENCSKYELAEEIWKHRREMQEVRKAMNIMEGAQQRVPYAPSRH